MGGVQLTIEHDPGAVGTIPRLGMFLEQEATRTNLKSLDLLKQHLELS